MRPSSAPALLSMQAPGLVARVARMSSASLATSVGASRIGAHAPSSPRASPRPAARRRRPLWSPRRQRARHRRPRRLLPRNGLGKPIRRRHPIGGAKSQPTAAGNPKSQRHHRSLTTASPAAPAPAEPSGKAADGPPDPTPSGVQSAAPGSAFGAAPSASLAQGPSSDLLIAGASRGTPRASALSAPRSTAPPVKEIDVDLSPGGVEDVSMTMRLAGDKLSVVIRAASSQTYGSIEGARDAIADRLAAIGQPLSSSLSHRRAGIPMRTLMEMQQRRSSTAGERQSRQSAASKAARTMRARLGAALLAICLSSFAGAHARGR